MNAKQLREALAEGKPIDVGQFVDVLERLEKALEIQYLTTVEM